MCLLEEMVLSQNVYQKESALLERWKQERSNYKVFCEDGILVESEWIKAKPKIVFLLKETYEHFYKIRGSKKGPRGTSGTFWRRMSIWTHIVEKQFNGDYFDPSSIGKIKEIPNSRIAYVNIKKNTTKKELNNEAYSNDDDIEYYAKSDKLFLLEQINNLNPDVIICCGTFRYCKHIFDQKEINKISNRLYKTGKTWLIDFEHPSQRKSYISNVESLNNIVSPICFESQ